MKTQNKSLSQNEYLQNRISDWLADNAFIQTNNLEQPTREYFKRLGSIHTRRAYFKAVARFFEWLINPEISTPADITTEIVQDHIDGLIDARPDDPTRDRHISVRTQALAALRGYFHHLAGRKIISFNPAEFANLPVPFDPRGKTEAVTPGEVLRLIAAINGDTPVGRRNRALVALMHYTGCRVGAVIKMQLKHVEDRQEVVLPEKGDKIHRVGMHPALLDILDAYLADLRYPERDDPLFQYWDGYVLDRTPLDYNAVYHLIRKATSAVLGRALTPHSFRATTITTLFEAGLPDYKIQKFANHKRLETTLRYNRAVDMTPEQKITLENALTATTSPRKEFRNKWSQE